MDVLSRRGAVLLSLILVGTTACGSGVSRTRFLPGPSGRINPIYDATVVYPDTTLIVGGLSYRGVEIDLKIEFDDATLRDADPLYTAEAHVVSLLAGGVAQTFVLTGSLMIEGTLDQDAWTTGLFGPIQVGTANLILELTGTLDDGRRRVSGQAELFGIPDPGSFVAVKRRRYLLTGTDLLSIGKVAMASVRYGNRITVAEDLEVTSSDPVARVEDGHPYVVNRFTFDYIQGLDPLGVFSTTLEFSTGNGSNPHDMVILPPIQGGTPSGVPEDDGPGIAFVTRYEPPFNDLAIFDLEDGTLIDSIDLTPYAANPDRLPRADQALLHDGLIYVTLQDANLSFTEFMTGRVVVVDPILRGVVDVIDLSGQNPFESLTHSEATGLIYVGLAGIFPGLLSQSLTGGVEAIDPAARRSLGLIVDDDDLGGNVSHVAIASATRGYCVVTDSTFRNFVEAFDPGTGQVLGTVFQTHNRISDLAVDGDGYLLIAEASFSAPRLLILDAATAQPITSLQLRLPPFSVAIATRSL